MNKEPVAKKVEAPAGANADGVLMIPLNDLETVDVSDRHIEQMARGYIMGSQAIGRRKEIRELLEEKVTKKIGRKGKYLTDKLFELIEGVYVVDKRGGRNGRDVRYYQVPPNLNAIIYALDRVLGKPKQQIEASHESKGVILVEHVIRNLANNPYRNNGKRSEQSGVGEDAGPKLGGRGTGDVAGHGGALTERVNEGVGKVAL